MNLWSKIEETGIIWGMQVLIKVYLIFGRTVLQVVLFPMLSCYWLINGSGRKASLQYLQRISKNQKQDSINPNFFTSYRHFISFSNALLEKVATWSGSLNLKKIEYHNCDEIVGHIKQGQGVLILSSHLGSLEVFRVIAHLREKVKINVLVQTEYVEKLNTLLNHYADSERFNLIHFTEVNAATAIMLKDKVEAGELIIIVADRIPVSGQNKAAQAAFLGSAAFFPQEPFILALLLKCPVYTLFCLKEKGKQIAYFDHFSDGLSFTKKQRTAAIEQCVQEYADQLQNYCLKAPLQWFNFYDFWLVKK